jgi:hypothetical protein
MRLRVGPALSPELGDVALEPGERSLDAVPIGALSPFNDSLVFFFPKFPTTTGSGLNEE